MVHGRCVRALRDAGDVASCFNCLVCLDWKLCPIRSSFRGQRVQHNGRMRAVPEEIAQRLLSVANLLGPSFESTRIDEIVEASGIPRATLYYYFDGKSQVLTFLLRESLHRLVERAGKVAAGPGDAASRLVELVRAQLRYMFENPGTSQLLFLSLGSAGAMPEVASLIDAGFHEPVRRLLREGAMDGSIRVQESDDLASSALFGALTSVGLRCLLSGDVSDADAIVDSLRSMFWNGLQPEAE